MNLRQTKCLILGAAVATSLALGFTGQPAHAGGPAPSAGGQTLVAATNSFGYWFTYFARSSYTPVNQLPAPHYVNAQVERYVAPSYPHRPGSARSGALAGDMHLMNTPNAWRFTVNRNDGTHAVETVHWLFGTNPHTPVVLLSWTHTANGWQITGARYLHDS